MNLLDEVSGYNHSVKKRSCVAECSVVALWWRESCLKLCSSRCVLVTVQVYTPTECVRLEKYTKRCVTIMQKNLEKTRMPLHRQREENGAYWSMDGQAICAGLLVWWSTEKLLPVNCLLSICSFCRCVTALPKCRADWTQLAITHKDLLFRPWGCAALAERIFAHSSPKWVAHGSPEEMDSQEASSCLWWRWKWLGLTVLPGGLPENCSHPSDRRALWGQQVPGPGHLKATWGNLQQSKGASEEPVPGNTRLDWNPHLSCLALWICKICSF